MKLLRSIQSTPKRGSLHLVRVPFMGKVWNTLSQTHFSFSNPAKVSSVCLALGLPNLHLH